MNLVKGIIILFKEEIATLKLTVNRAEISEKYSIVSQVNSFKETINFVVRASL